MWFAFNILSLTYCTQLIIRNHQDGSRCDLLSISYLWHTVHNLYWPESVISPVVICFQYLIFDILYTTELILELEYNGCDLLSISYLWHTVHNKRHSGWLLPFVVICFQYLIFDILYTTTQIWRKPYYSCDLLSISYLWHTVHNQCLFADSSPSVVICFQYLIFDILYTTIDIIL